MKLKKAESIERKRAERAAWRSESSLRVSLRAQDKHELACDLMHSQFPIEGSLYRQYCQTSVGTPNCKRNEFKWDYSYYQV